MAKPNISCIPLYLNINIRLNSLTSQIASCGLFSLQLSPSEASPTDFSKFVGDDVHRPMQSLTEMSSIFEFSVETHHGEMVSLRELTGAKAYLIVNVASK